jgi:predicted HicB family RNase H-like nuclease
MPTWKIVLDLGKSPRNLLKEALTSGYLQNSIKKAALMAMEAKESLNSFVAEAIRSRINKLI